MRIKYFTTKKIIGKWGSIEAYAERRKLPPQSVRKLISTLDNNKKVEAQLRKDGYGPELDKDFRLKLRAIKQRKNGKGK